MRQTAEVLLVIPSYNPDDRLIRLLAELTRRRDDPARVSGESSPPPPFDVVIVDDGSGPQYSPIFETAEREYGCRVLRHAVNLGKGRALKTAFNYFLTAYPGTAGVVTVDSDGQHGADDVLACAARLAEKPHSLIVGYRRYTEDAAVPKRNRLLNTLTCKMLKAMCGIGVSDSQTGLRGIPAEFVRHLMNVPGERFDFELNMLIESKQENIPMAEIPIQSIEGNNCSVSPAHSLLYLWNISKRFLKFAASSITCFGIDITSFTVFVLVFKRYALPQHILWATILSRVLSSLANYLINRHFVFANARTNRVYSKTTLIKYYSAEAAEMLLSAALVSLVYRWLGAFETVIKIVVDGTLFFLNYPVQQFWVFRRKKQAD